MLQRPHRVLRGIGQHREDFGAQDDLAGKPEKGLEDVETSHRCYWNSGQQVLSPGGHGRGHDAGKDDAVDEKRLPAPKVKYSGDISRDQITSRADETGDQVADGSFDARPQGCRLTRRT